eukprot:Skav200186  [mRNA]  locus=scaffold2383:111354:112322:+ [translate_table: standard]
MGEQRFLGLNALRMAVPCGPSLRKSWASWRSPGGGHQIAGRFTKRQSSSLIGIPDAKADQLDHGNSWWRQAVASNCCPVSPRAARGVKWGRNDEKEAAEMTGIQLQRETTDDDLRCAVQ